MSPGAKCWLETGLEKQVTAAWDGVGRKGKASTAHGQVDHIVGPLGDGYAALAGGYGTTI